MKTTLIIRIIRRTLIILLLSHLGVPSGVYAQEVQADDIVGTWLIEEDGIPVEKIEVYKCDSLYCGKIVWINNPDSSKSPALDRKNKNKELQNRPLLNLEILKDYKFDGEDCWKDGKLYAHRKGKTVSPKLTLIDKNHMKIEIKLLFLKKSFTWKRVLIDR